MITLVVARARNGAIGKDNQIPWHVPADLKLFQRETMGGAIIMGRKTWESLPVKPLKNRLNIVVSRDTGVADHVVASLDEAIALAQSQGHCRIYGIGGQQIYTQMLGAAHRLLITEVDLDIPEADAFFPRVDEAQWREIARLDLPSDGPACTARELLRR
ncbi:MAG: dihydrofolate reductase [Pseudotabrizicola sp.]|uniref:dihydrofolate reductase n=1 Tax=Pseudotabrizicola sp. TaxID=2939647 RepID=UPI00271A0B33|nr:dihydrofolate reductase [Pseudotabrizicola sp.]MDO8882991.1 dihydrofolate reductase [Pseudotabrizicola sp.]MDP2079770.1 dihydrofolate reductase [Pseudotabrizicola sp.]MDZ7574771.1 dihydrofolate reductase [Pseudotabrizicola sp.]